MKYIWQKDTGSSLKLVTIREPIYSENNFIAFNLSINTIKYVNLKLCNKSTIMWTTPLYFEKLEWSTINESIIRN